MRVGDWKVLDWLVNEGTDTLFLYFCDFILLGVLHFLYYCTASSTSKSITSELNNEILNVTGLAGRENLSSHILSNNLWRME